MLNENKEYWPEKYAISKLITRQTDIDKIIKGEKTTIRRNDRYADIGDEIGFGKLTFIVNNIYQQKLKSLTNKDAKQEGYNNLEEYKTALTSIHQGAVWDPEAVVWTHELKQI